MSLQEQNSSSTNQKKDITGHKAIRSFGIEPPFLGAKNLLISLQPLVKLSSFLLTRHRQPSDNLFNFQPLIDLSQTSSTLVHEATEWNSELNALNLFSSDILRDNESDKIVTKNSIVYQKLLSSKVSVVDEIASDRAVVNAKNQTSPQRQKKKQNKKATQSKSRTKATAKKTTARSTTAPIIEQVPTIDSSPQLQHQLQANTDFALAQQEVLPRTTEDINKQQDRKSNDLDVGFSLQSSDPNQGDEREKDNVESEITNAIPANLDRILEPDTTTSVPLAPTSEISDRGLTLPDDTLIPSNIEQSIETQPHIVSDRIPSSPANDPLSSLESIPQPASLAPASRTENTSAQPAQTILPAVPTLPNSGSEITPVQTKSIIASGQPELQPTEPSVPDFTPVAQKVISPDIAQQGVDTELLVVSDRNFTVPEDIPASQIVQPNSLQPSGETDSLILPTSIHSTPIHSEQISTVVSNTPPIESTTIAPLEAEVSTPQTTESSRSIYSKENTPHFQPVTLENVQELQQPDEQKISPALDNIGTANLTTEHLPHNSPKIPLQPVINKERTEVTTPSKTQNLGELPALQVGQDDTSDRELTLDPTLSAQEVSNSDTETGVEAEPLVVSDRYFPTSENLPSEILSNLVQQEPEQKTEFETSELLLSEVLENDSHGAIEPNSVKSEDLFSHPVDTLDKPAQQRDLVNPTSQTSTPENKTREKATQFKSTTRNTTAQKTSSNLIQQVPIIDSTAQAHSQPLANRDFSPAQPEELLKATTEVSRQQDNHQSDIDLASAVEPSIINKRDEAKKDDLESQRADIIPIPASLDRIVESEPTTPVQLAPTGEISHQELTLVDNTPTHPMCDFLLSPLFKGVGGSQDYDNHEKIPPSPPCERGEQEKVAHRVTPENIAIPDNVEPSVEIEVEPSVEIENTSSGVVEPSVAPVETQQSSTDTPRAGDRNLSRSHPAAATSFENTISAQPDIAAESESLFPFEQVPPQGLAVGGQVPTVTNLSRKPIAPSDTVPAMLTPGEFVVNATDAQKHLDILQHINQGGSVEHLPEISTKVESSDTPVKPSLTPKRLVQRQIHASLPGVVKTLVSPTLQLAAEAQPASPLNPLQPDLSEAPKNSSHLSKTHYTATELIYRKHNNPNPSAPTTSIPEQWSSVEDLLLSNFAVDNSYASTSKKIHHQSSATVSTPETTHQRTVKSFVQPKGFDKGGEVSADPSTPAKAVTHTIEMPTPSATKADPNVLEMLAREIYQRLRQRLELERERHGFYSGRLPW
ncbi:hypothetical protein H6G17_25025 [Chroococcidiopsis sp. FACHB-1243]|uniref:hypothetical protein n=1 Tax=Chroococcidiopsis sp. [FACHB-1243] TaxID=2692781 RepID=UPI0017814C8C|nr:hypothetical protein [Chroococcidiopsis sp. [FACHB-1243]]MBD2308736.1 hypothetical protein [Chroococcidiopsis sp. [FACHB-1243]]